MVEYAPGTGPGYAGSFSIDVSNWVLRTRQRVDEVIKRALMDIFDTIIEIMPVDTGYARSNWDVGQSAPDVNLARGGPGPYPSPKERVRSAVRALVIQDGLVCYFYNNTRYIIPLEYGHSRYQAPRGMVRVTLTNFQNYVASAAAGG